jgi:hypothetical protein
MHALKHLALACLVAGSVLATAPAKAEATTEATVPAFDAAAKRQAIETAAKLLVDNYVFPDVGQRAADMLTRNLAAGRYDAATTRAAFAAHVTKDLRDITHDKHLGFWAEGEAPPLLPPSLFGFSRADRLKGNIGYVVVDSFFHKDLSRLGADVAMKAVASTDALIIDVRNNDGGVPNAVAYLISFFVDGATPVHVNDLLWRQPGTTDYRRERFETQPTPTSYLNKPVYVLIGPRSFSGAEEFAYDLQAMKLGTIVGEVSKGGSNPVQFFPLGPGLGLDLPTGKGENPITRSNWEGRGVQPDIAVADDQSFTTAYAAAFRALGRPVTGAMPADAATEAKLLTLRTASAPGSEAALRRLIGEMAAGHPPKEMLGYTMAWVAETYVSSWQADLTRLGALQELTFVEVDREGWDVYEARFANGTLVFRLAMQGDGKIALSDYRPK